MEAYKLGKTPIQLPSGWHEVPFSKALKILSSEMTEIETLALLTDLDVETIRRSTDIDTIFYFLNTFKYLGKLPDMGLAFPASVGIGDDLFMLPWVNVADKWDLGKVDVGQVEDMYQTMKPLRHKEGEPVATVLDTIGIMPELAAIYLYPIVTAKKYDGVKALRLAKELRDKMSFKDIFVMGSFFLTRQTDLMNGQAKEWRQRNTSLRRFKLALRTLMNRLAYMVHSI